MTDEGQPLSRRERRAREQREAARGMENTDALAELGTGDVPTLGVDGTPLSRRERRRLERAVRPMETWTAEEEMIATGQIPAMTPERIAEQERIARAKADEAQREAEAASQSLPVVNDEPAGDATAEEAPAVDEPAVGDSAVDEQRMSAQAEVVPADEDSDTAREATAEEPEAASFVPPVEEEAPEAPMPRRTSVMPQPATDEPEAEPEPAVEAPASPPEPATDEPASEPEPEPEPAATSTLGLPPGMTPETFMSLFPPGSLQRKLMEQQLAEQEQDAAADAAAHGEQPEGTADAEQSADVAEVEQPLDSADEIRRLTAEAIAGIESAHQAHDEPEDERAAVPAPLWGQPAWEQPSDPAIESGQSPADESYVPEASDLEVDESAAQEFGEQPLEPIPSEFADSAAESPETLERQPSDPSFDAVVADDAAADQVAAPWPVEPHEMPFTAVQQQEPPAQPEADGHVALTDASAVPDATSIWDSHPLTSVEAPASPLPDHDGEPESQVQIPQPDLSQYQPPTYPSPATAGNLPFVEPVPTGQIEVPRREVPALDESEGGRHFRWAHLAVFGAVAFVLGVVVWNVAGNG